MISELRNHLGEALDFEYLEGDSRYSDWLVILGHGVTGNRHRPVVAETAAALHREGFSTLAFSFSGNGESEGDFRDSCVSKGVKDLECVLQTAADRKVIYIGHSMGAAVGVLAAVGTNGIDRLISLAGMVDTRRFAETEFGEETPDEGCMWDEKSCPLTQAFMDDLCRTIASVVEQAAEVRVPWLLVHGSADDVVLPQDSVDVKKVLGDRVTHVVIDGADHSFNEPYRDLQVKAVLDWLATQCS